MREKGEGKWGGRAQQREARRKRPEPSQNVSRRWERLRKEGALHGGERRLRRELEKHPEKVARARGGRMVIAQARKNGLWGTGRWSSDHCGSSTGMRWKREILKRSKEATAKLPAMSRRGFNKGRGCAEKEAGGARSKT